MKRKFNELKNHFRYDIKGRTSCWDRLPMDTLLRSRQRNGTLKTKNISFLDDVISLFFLSLCVVCYPARCFCPKWLFSCKEPLSLGPQSSPKRLSSLLAFKNTPIVLKLRTFLGHPWRPPILCRLPWFWDRPRRLEAILWQQQTIALGGCQTYLNILIKGRVVFIETRGSRSRWTESLYTVNKFIYATPSRNRT